MASKLIIPFDNKPVSTAQGTSGTYTVPANKYALVTISVSGYAGGTADGYINSSIGATAAVATSSATEDSFNQTVSLWLVAGDTVTCTISAASDSYSTASSAAYFVRDSCSGVTTATITVKGATYMVFNAFATASSSCSSSSSDNYKTVVGAVTGAGNWGYFAQEYAVIS
jgi:hypothetical protein